MSRIEEIKRGIRILEDVVSNMKKITRAQEKNERLKEQCELNNHSIVLNIGKTSLDAVYNTYVCVICGERSDRGFDDNKFGDSSLIINVPDYEGVNIYPKNQELVLRAISYYILYSAGRKTPLQLKRDIEKNYVDIVNTLKEEESKERKRKYGYKI